MKYSKVYIDTLAYELPPVVVSSEELEERIESLYRKFHFEEGQLENLTGIEERRWWEEGYPVSQGAIAAAKKALENSSVPSQDIDVLIFGGVCREGFEPATATFVASALDISPDALIYDISNACLGALNGIIDIANRIELGQSKAGLVVSCESAREINDIIIERMLKNCTMENFTLSLATLTGGSGTIAILVTDGSYSSPRCRKLLGGAVCAEPKFHQLCRWGMESADNGNYVQNMYTDSVAVLNNGTALGQRTWNKFLQTLDWTSERVDKTICHQVGSAHQDSILSTLGLSSEKDFVTYPFLGNIGTVSLPITAAIAEERQFLQAGDHVAFLGIGSGLNCMMLGWQW